MSRAVPVLMYHHVSPHPGLVTITPERFRAQMRTLAERGWHTLSAADFAGFLNGQPVPPKSVLITFDDGYLDNYLHAHPVLVEYRLHALFFVVTGWLGDGPPRAPGQSDPPDHRECMRRIQAGRSDDVMLRWSELAAMRAAGSGEFHSHTHTHTRWDRTVADATERRERLYDDLLRSRAALSANLGAASEHLCWPQGYFDGDYQKVAMAAGFRYLYSVRRGVATPATDPASIPRIVAKDRAGGWLRHRLAIYRWPGLAAWYARAREGRDHA